jgi:hypothetical protein
MEDVIDLTEKVDFSPPSKTQKTNGISSPNTKQVPLTNFTEKSPNKRSIATNEDHNNEIMKIVVLISYPSNL